MHAPELPFTPLPDVETIVLRSGLLSAALAPARGGMVTRFYVGARAIFYLDESTLLDPAKSVRGGNPILFPTPGKLHTDTWQWEERTGHLPQHGFARTQAWRVGARSANACTLHLSSNAHTLAQFPWQFELTQHCELGAHALELRYVVRNLDARAMPYALGFHPYFSVPSAHKSASQVVTNAARAFDNMRKTTGVLPALALGEHELDLHLLDHHSAHRAAPAQAALSLWDGARIALRASAEFKRWVLWSKPETAFVCLEPWTALGNALGAQGIAGTPPADAPLVLAPAATHEFFLHIALEA